MARRLAEDRTFNGCGPRAVLCSNPRPDSLPCFFSEIPCRWCNLAVFVWECSARNRKPPAFPLSSSELWVSPRERGFCRIQQCVATSVAVACPTTSFRRGKSTRVFKRIQRQSFASTSDETYEAFVEKAKHLVEMSHLQTLQTLYGSILSATFVAITSASALSFSVPIATPKFPFFRCKCSGDQARAFENTRQKEPDGKSMRCIMTMQALQPTLVGVERDRQTDVLGYFFRAV